MGRGLYGGGVRRGQSGDWAPKGSKAGGGAYGGGGVRPRGGVLRGTKQGAVREPRAVPAGRTLGGGRSPTGALGGRSHEAAAAGLGPGRLQPRAARGGLGPAPGSGSRAGGRPLTMTGKHQHFQEPEVGCCGKYFLFGFNIVFWVRAGWVLGPVLGMAGEGGSVPY